MHFNQNKFITTSALFIVVALFSACTYTPATISPTAEDENIFGEKPDAISKMNRADGTEKNDVVLFDETTRRIHHFTLSPFAWVSSLSVIDPGEKHFVIYDDDTNYIVDMSKNNITIFDKSRLASDHQLQIPGAPVSVAFDSTRGLLVVLDNQRSVGILKINSDGHVTKRLIKGLKLDSGAIALSGDLNESGKLIIALDGETMTVIDIEATLNQFPGIEPDTKVDWISTVPFATSLSEISWLAPVRGKPDLVFVRTETKLALFDLVTKTVISSFTLGNYNVEKLSKSIDAHVIIRNPYSSVSSSAPSSSEFVMVYVEGNQLKNVSLVKQQNRVLTSQLNLARDTWIFSDVSRKIDSIFNDVDEIKNTRVLKKYRLTDMLSTKAKPIQDGAQIVLGSNYIFALIPEAELGHVIRSTIDGSQGDQEVRGFNMHIIHGAQ